MRRIHREGPATPSPFPQNSPSTPEDVPFADKLRQQESNSISSQSSRRQAISDETHSLLSGGSRSKRKPPKITNVTINRQQQQRPNRGRMRTVLAAFGDCTVKRNEEGKRMVSCGVAPSQHQSDMEKEEPEKGIRTINWRLLVIAAIVIEVFRLGRNRGRQSTLRGQTTSNEKNFTVGSMHANVKSDESDMSNIDMFIAQLDGTDLMHSPQNSSYEPSNRVNHTFHQAVFPTHINHLSNLTTPYNSSIETPYFWDVHFSGESVAEAVFSTCHGLVLAAEFGLRQKDYDEEKLQVFELDGDKYVNVDTTTFEGILRASSLGLASSHLSDVIISPYVNPIASDIFSPASPGRMFALFRHPVDRALGMYYYLARATWDPMYNPALAMMSIAEYAKSRYIENNWLTRFLVKKPGGKLNHADLLLAKKILKFKCLVGLYDDMEASLARFHRYFGWNADSPEKAGDIAKCRKQIVSKGDKVLNHPVSVKGEEWDSNTEGVIKEGTFTWNAIAKQNKFDLELFEYAKRLFRSQGEEIFNIV